MEGITYCNMKWEGNHGMNYLLQYEIGRKLWNELPTAVGNRGKLWNELPTAIRNSREIME